MPPRVVLDTNVLVAALRSSSGASFRLLSLIGSGQFEVVVSVPLTLEYEEVLNRRGVVPLGGDDVGAVLDYLCKVGRHQAVFYLWRPYLRDPDDDMVLELAVAAGCDAIVTHNTRDFAGVDRFGLRAVRPAELLRSIGERPPGEPPTP